MKLVVWCFVLFYLAFVFCERKAIIIARKQDNSHVHFLQTDFNDPSFEIYIINKIPSKHSWKEFTPDSYSKISNPPPIHLSDAPWIGFSVPKEMNITFMNITEPRKQGRECAAFLYFIIQNYHHLPDWMLFGGGNPQRKPFQVREYFDNPEGYFQSFSGSMVQRCYDDTRRGACAFRSDFKDILAQVGIDAPDCVTTWCCNYFIVHKSRVLRHPLSHYHLLLDFVIHERVGEAGWKHGCFYLEHAWHMLFGEPAHLYVTNEKTVLNGDCMLSGENPNEYVSNPERELLPGMTPYVWLKRGRKM